MFTGLVREVGRVASFEDGRLVVECATAATLGDSVALDGVCLTVVDGTADSLSFDVVPETLARVKPFRERVNVEPALRAGEPLGGHYVQGHVDGVGHGRCGRRPRATARASRSTRRELAALLRREGLDRRRRRLADGRRRSREDGFEVALIPHTLALTTLALLAPGDAVNLEADVLGQVRRATARRATMRP